MGRILKGRGILGAEYLRTLETSREVLEAAREGTRRIEDEARERGRLEGLASVAAVLVEAEAERSRWLEGARADLARLAIEVARALNARAADQDPALVADLCREAVARAAGARRLAVHVAPGDAHALAGLEWPVAAAVEIVPDPRIAAGGCVVRTDLGTVDGRIETRLDDLAAALQEVVGRHRESGT
jgi:flagellar biosynthesis/type III secretory pathway protein FliH